MPRLDDPAHRNALSKELSDALAAAVGRALDGGARVIVLTTAPLVFCTCGSLDALLDRRVPLADMYAGTTRSCGERAARPARRHVRGDDALVRRG
ncbi:hypothetical protein BJF79_09130 [Actinomadura sp. CNU-125]|nr:hypothetical protein BJF79_09130 [Actinomadura sp. CNU-125]